MKGIILRATSLAWDMFTTEVILLKVVHLFNRKEVLRCNVNFAI